MDWREFISPNKSKIFLAISLVIIIVVIGQLVFGGPARGAQKGDWNLCPDKTIYIKAFAFSSFFPARCLTRTQLNTFEISFYAVLLIFSYLVSCLTILIRKK